MTVELRPLGVRCNIQCQYCYQQPQRDAQPAVRAYDMDKMKAGIAAEGGPFSLFGGEPLLVPEADLEELWRWGLEQYGRNAVQTNGTLIDDRHIALFRRYKVNVGISLDGPGALNDVRWHGTADNTRKATAKSQRAIERLCREGIPPSIIVTLHRNNAAASVLPALLDWVRDLDALGVRWLRLHLLEVDHPAVRDKYALGIRENIDALRAFAALQPQLKRLRIDLFDDMRALLLGDDAGTTCVWNACDPYTTRAVRGVEGNGVRSNCGRTNKDGIDFVKAGREGFERYLALYATPQASGGCRGCRFFLMCKGQCPGTAIDGDWRNRTEHCEVWKALFTDIENELRRAGWQPLSLSDVRPALERAVVASWTANRPTTLRAQLDAIGRAGLPAMPAWRRRLHRIPGAVHGAAHRG